MADITTDVLIIGTGPAGSASAALLSTYGVDNMVINRYRWLANTPRAHITNQRTMEVLRDLGREVEDEVYLFAAEQDLMGENVFCTSLAGEEIGRMKSWGKHPLSRAEHQLSSPTFMNDLPQTFMEPLLFKAACSRGTQARMSTEYRSHVQDADVGGIGTGLVRMVRPWNEWLIVWGYDINQPAPDVDTAFATKVARELIGDPDIDVEIEQVSTWTVNNLYATQMSNGRVFCMGDATHRHPPSNGLGSNTSIQDAFNLAWKLAHVIKGKAGPKLLASYSHERAPVAKQIVTRANKSIDEFGPIFEALGLLDSIDPMKMQQNMDARCNETPEAEEQRKKIRESIAFKVYEFDAHGVEMNQRYRSDAIVVDGQPEPPFEKDAELHYQPTTWPGARLPHVWLFDGHGGKVSTLDLAGHGRFALLTGIGGQGWIEAASMIGRELGIDIAAYSIGPRQHWQDFTGDCARSREVRDSGIVLVRPDQHVCWRRETIAGDPVAELRRVFKTILDR